MTTLARSHLGSPIHALRPGAVQEAAYTTAAGTIESAVGLNTTVVRVYVTTDAHVSIGPDPTATTEDTPMAADAPEYFRVNPGSDKVSAVQVSGGTGGDVFVTEMI